MRFFVHLWLNQLVIMMMNERMTLKTINRSIALAVFTLLFVSTTATAQQKREAYEFAGEIPVYVDSIQASLAYPMAWRNQPAGTSLADWRSAARRLVFSLMGPEPPRAQGWDAEVLAEEQREGYKAVRMAFNLSRWYRVKAYVLIPDHAEGQRLPAVNLLHDHGAHLYIGKEKMIRPFDDAQEVLDDARAWADQLYEGQFLGDYLAQHGYVVFSIDAPLWGGRGRKEGVDRQKYDLIAGNMMMLGRNLCAQMHYDDLRSTEFLAQLPYVDASRVGCAGCSMGGYRAWMLAALSDYVKAGAAICWMVTTEAQLTTRYGRKENGGFANCIPLLRNFMDYPDVASLAAPKPMLFVSGSQDKLFPVPGVRQAYDVMQGVWGKDGALVTEILDQPHECNRQNQLAILNFLNRHL